MLMRGFEQARLFAETDSKGEFLLRGLENKKTAYLAAIHPSYAAAEAEAAAKATENLAEPHLSELQLAKQTEDQRLALLPVARLHHFVQSF